MAATISTLENFKIVLNDYVRLTAPVTCLNCGKTVKMVGETKKNGNWWCGYCFNTVPFEESAWPVAVPFTKLGAKLEPETQGQPLGLPAANFPMNIETGFLVPSYGSRTSRKQNLLLSVANDFTRFGRIKSGSIWQFDLTWNGRASSEYEVLLAFADSQGFHLPFNYTDPVRQTSHILYFDSDILMEPESFDTLNFSVKLTE
jgi:hypothetical protein